MKAREARKNQAHTVIKEMKLRPKIDPHDYDTKKGHVVRFLKQGDKVKITIMFRGREQSRPELGFRLLQRLADDVQDLGFIESSPKQDGRNMIMVLGPHKKKTEAMAEARAIADARKAERQGRTPAPTPPRTPTSSLRTRTTSWTPRTSTRTSTTTLTRTSRRMSRRTSPRPRTPPPRRRPPRPPLRPSSRPRPPRAPDLPRSERPGRPATRVTGRPARSPQIHPSRPRGAHRAGVDGPTRRNGDMPKQKTHSGASKRFKISGSGKVLRERGRPPPPPGAQALDADPQAGRDGRARPRRRQEDQEASRQVIALPPGASRVRGS